MNDEDEILRRLMSNKGDSYIMDNGFTNRVLEALPQTHSRKFRATRRAVLILTATVTGCAISAFLAAPALPAISHLLGDTFAKIQFATDPLSLGCYLSVSLATASAFAFFCLRQSHN